jgi:ADP-ribose pyrophosphatase YjhB (NUDIX family)
MTEPKWLAWSKQLAAVAQNGLCYASNPFDIERYQSIRDIAAAILADHSDADPQRIAGLFAEQVGYATPKVDVRGAIFQNNTILLVKERIDGGWTLPGGWADVNESPGEAVVREVFEESGYRSRATKLLAVFDRSKHPHVPLHPFHIYKLFFLCELTGGTAQTSNETDGVDFFAEGQLPELSVSRITEGQIARLFEHSRRPDLPTDFD